MVQTVMLYAGAALLIIWGAAHIAIPTRDIIDGFGPISEDNRRILLMEWLVEGLALIFIGALVVLVTAVAGVGNVASVIVYRASALMLIVMASVSIFTGARTPILPMKLCPPIFATAAVLFWAPTFW